MGPIGISGLVAAPHTPMTEDGALNLPVVDKQVELLLEGGVAAAFACGTTGEGPSLSTAERMQLAERWVAAAPKALPVIVHVGHSSVEESRALAAHAQKIGARAFSALSPFFFKPSSVDDLVEFTARVASAAPGLPFYFYHLPSVTGVSLSMVEYLGRARKRIPNLVGIKYTHNDLMEFQQLIGLTQGWGEVMFGRDEILLSGLVAGGRGAIGSTYNYAAPVYRKLIEAFNRGEVAEARRLQSEAVKLIEVLRRYGEIPVAKAVLTMMGVPCGPARTPLGKLTETQVDAIYQELSGLDIFTRPLKR